MIDPDDLELRRLTRRISSFAFGCYVAFGIGLVISSGFASLLGLTCSAAVVMISFLWLEDIVKSVLQAAPQVKPWKLGLYTLARFAFLGLALSVAIFVARFQPLSVLLGFSVIVGAIMIEALCSVVKSMKV
jgi:hypothetical protein